IRQRTNGARSLDDFCKRFHGAPSGDPAVRTYTFEDVVLALNEVAPYDWKGFLTSRLDATGAHAPLGGVEGSGWHLAYTDVRSERLKADEKLREFVDLSYSLGFSVKEKTGAVIDVFPGSPAYKAGIGPGMQIVAVNG